MTRLQGVSDRIVTGALTIATLAMAGTLVHREFGRRPAKAAEAEAVGFVPEWRRLFASGVALGDTNSPVNIIEFADLQCPVCRRQHDVLKEVRREFASKTALTVIHFPLESHPFAAGAARAAECARQSGVFEQFVDAVYREQDSLGYYSWTSFAKRAGVRDTIAFDHCATDTGPVAGVLAGVNAGRRLGVAGTPTLLLNGWRFDGALEESQMKRVIRDLLDGRQPAHLSQAPGRSAPRVIHRNGVEVLTFDRDALGQAPQFTLLPLPLAKAGGADGAPGFDLTHTWRVVLLRDGRMATYESVHANVLFFGADGRGLRAFGRPGKGPGEFNYATLIGVGGDTVLAFDRGNNRLTWITPDRGVAAIKTFEGKLPSANNLVGILPGGRYLVSSTGLVQRFDGDSASRPPAMLHSLTINGPPQVITRAPDLKVVMVATNYRSKSGGRTLPEATPVRFGPRAFFAVWDTMVVSASSENGYTLDLLTPSGALRSQIAVAGPRRPVTKAMRSAAIDFELRTLRAPGPEAPVNATESERLIRESPTADSLPPYSGLFVSSDKTLWVIDAIVRGDTAWNATGFRQDGSIARRLHASGSGWPVAFDNDRVVVRTEDADGVVSLEVRRMVPQRPK